MSSLLAASAAMTGLVSVFALAVAVTSHFERSTDADAAIRPSSTPSSSTGS